MPMMSFKRRFYARTNNSEGSRSARISARGCIAIAVNCALDLLRSRGRLDRHYGGDPEEAEMMGAISSSDPQQDRLLLSAELRDQVTAAMEKLSGNERTAFVLRHFEGMPVEEIGKTLGIQVNAAKHTIFRAVRKLRESLEPFVRSSTCNI